MMQKVHTLNKLKSYVLMGKTNGSIEMALFPCMHGWSIMESKLINWNE
jgi:hypothetical protein